MDMVVNIFVLSFCYVLYMRKERTLSRSKKPDEFSPSAQTQEFAYLHNFFHPDGFSFSRSELGLKAPRRRPKNTTQKFKIQKRKEQLSLVVVVVLPLANFFLTFPRFLPRVFALLHTHFNAQRNTTTKHYGKDIFLNSSSLTRRSRREKFYISSIEK